MTNFVVLYTGGTIVGAGAVSFFPATEDTIISADSLDKTKGAYMITVTHSFCF